MTEFSSSTFEQTEDYQAALDAIVGRPFIPELIDNYAEGALNDLIALVHDCTRSYQSQTAITHDSLGAAERAAFVHYGLDNIEAILGNIADKAEEISQLDSVITSAKIIDQVIVPPDPADMVAGNGGDTPLERQTIIPKLKTLLFILSNDFEVDVHDHEQLSLTAGVVSELMMRKTSYTVVELAKLSRTIFICDEIDNITYVFDDAILQQNAISANDLPGLTKTELNDLLGEYPSLGKRIVFNKNFAHNLIAAIKNPGQDFINSEDLAEGPKYLYPPAPEGFLSNRGIARMIGVDSSSVTKAVQLLGDDIGETDQYRFRTRIATGYSPEQQAMIRAQLEARGFFLEKLPEGYLSINGISKETGIAHPIIAREVNELGDTLGEIKKSRLNNYFSPEQQAMIRAQLEAKGLFAGEAPEGYLSLHGLTKLFLVSYNTISRVIESLGDNLGETSKYRFGARVVTSYSPEQQAMIRAQLEAKGLFTGEAPEGYISRKHLIKILVGVDRVTVNNAIQEVADNLGEVPLYRFGQNRQAIAPCYSPEQQEIIKQYLIDNGLLAAQVTA